MQSKICPITSEWCESHDTDCPAEECEEGYEEQLCHVEAYEGEY